MAASFIASAATGAGLELVFGTFLKVVFEVKKTNSQFAPALKLLEATVNDLTPDIKRIDAFNRDFDRPEEMSDLKELMTKGEQLVLKCLKISRYNIFKRYILAKKLISLNNSIPQYIGSVMQIIQFADQKETLFEVKQLNNQIRKSLPRCILGVCSPPELKVDPVGLETPLMELKGKLLGDELPLVVISAPSGWGKTTLATAICQDSEVKDIFKGNILFVTAGRSPDMMIIVGRLLEHYNFQQPKLQSEDEAILELEKLMRKIAPQPVLLVIDDVWSGSESLLEKLKFQILNYQILVTSCSEFPRISSTYKIRPLSDDDAIALFTNTALMNDENSFIPEQDLVSQIVKACKGYPKAIARAGSSLRGRPPAEWRKRAKESFKSSAASSFEAQESFESKSDATDEENEVKECSVDQGSFPHLASNTQDARPSCVKIELHKSDKGDDDIVDFHKVSCQVSAGLPNTSKDDIFGDERFNMQQDIDRGLAILRNNTGIIDQGNDLAMKVAGTNCPNPEIMPIAV
ncbi:Probable disease resistance protein At5g66900 [Linum perenne]